MITFLVQVAGCKQVLHEDMNYIIGCPRALHYFGLWCISFEHVALSTSIRMTMENASMLHVTSHAVLTCC